MGLYLLFWLFDLVPAVYLNPSGSVFLVFILYIILRYINFCCYIISFRLLVLPRYSWCIFFCGFTIFLKYISFFPLLFQVEFPPCVYIFPVCYDNWLFEIGVTRFILYHIYWYQWWSTTHLLVLGGSTEFLGWYLVRLRGRSIYQYFSNPSALYLCLFIIFSVFHEFRYLL